MINGNKHQKRHFAAMTAQSILPSVSPAILDAIDAFGDCCFRNENTASRLVARRQLTETVGRQINNTVSRLTLDIAERDETIARLQRALLAEREALLEGHSMLHELPNNEECKCSQCRFVRLRKAALAQEEA